MPADVRRQQGDSYIMAFCDDTLRGLKENVIIGRLIPAGTGYEAVAKVGTPEE